MNIHELAEKLQRGNISSDELKKLSALLNENDIKNLEEDFNEQWKNSSGVVIGTNPDKLFRQLRKQLKVREKAGLNKFMSERKQYYSWREFLKYAAILVVGIISSWLIFNMLYDPNPSVKEADFLTVEVNNGSKSRVRLNDGTMVDLNSGSRLSYPSSASRDNRYVRLTGEAYFDVLNDPKHPFYVYTEDITVKALGTKFNVRAYPGEKTSETTLITGKVEVYSNMEEFKPEEKPVIALSPNQKVIIRRSVTEEKKGSEEVIASKGTIMKVPEIKKNIRTELDTEWRNNVLIFDNECFSTIINKMERWYGVEIEKQDGRLDTVRFTGKFDRESILDVLYALSQIEPFTFEIHKDKVILKTK